MARIDDEVRSDRKTILFFPLNTAGHINALLGIADKLKKHGHRTVFLSQGELTSTSVVDRGHEAEYIDDKKPWYDPADNKCYYGAEKWAVMIDRCKIFFRMSPLEAATRTFELCEVDMFQDVQYYDSAFAEHFHKIKPDAIVVDNYFVAPSVVTGPWPWMRVHSANPLALLDSNEYCPPRSGGFSIPPEDPKTNPKEWEEHKQKWSEYKEQLEQVIEPHKARWLSYLESKGCPKLEKKAMSHDSPHINLYMYPKCIDYDQLYQYPPRWMRCDSLLRKPPPDEPKDAMQVYIDGCRKRGYKLVYFSMGSLASADVDLMTNLIEILSKSPHSFIVSKGLNGGQFELPLNMWGENFLEQTRALAQVDMVITHGGNNSITECFYFGCPMLVMPSFSDQLDNAQRVEDLGLGKRMDPYKPNEEELLAAIEDIMNDEELAKRMESISKEMQSSEGSDKAADLVEILASEGKIDEATFKRFKGL